MARSTKPRRKKQAPAAAAPQPPLVLPAEFTAPFAPLVEEQQAPTDRGPQPLHPEVGQRWWTQVSDGGGNPSWWPWLEVELTWVSGTWSRPPGEHQLAHVVEGVTLKPVGKNALTLCLARNRLAWEPPPGARLWGAKDRKAHESRTAADQPAGRSGMFNDGEGDRAAADVD